MTDHERGAYTPPTDGPLAFEPREPIRGARPLPITLIVSVLVLLGLAAAIFVFYRSGVRQASSTPQPVGTPVGEMKAAPPPEAQPQDPAEGLQIYRSEGGQPGPAAQGQPQFTAPPEQPQARPVSPPVTLVPPQAITPPPPAGHVSESALRPAQPPPAQLAAAPPPEPVAKPAPALQAAPAAPVPRIAVPAPEKAKPQPALEKKAAPEKAPASKAAAEPAAKPAAGGAARVQIGAVSSPALADKTWNEAVSVAPGLAVGKGKSVEKVDKDGKTLYRTSVTGFASRDAAQAFCAKLKAAGKACFVK